MYLYLRLYLLKAHLTMRNCTFGFSFLSTILWTRSAWTN